MSWKLVAFAAALAPLLAGEGVRWGCGAVASDFTCLRGP